MGSIKISNILFIQALITRIYENGNTMKQPKTGSMKLLAAVACGGAILLGAIETGMQNAGLATSLAATSFPNLALATLPEAIFSIWHNISGAILAWYFAENET